MSRLPVILSCVGLLAGCTTAQMTTAQSTATTAAPAVTTLAALAAANNSTVATLVVKGQAFCGKIGGVDADVVALAGVVGMLTPYASVLGMGAQAVAAACNAISLIPVAPPTTVPLASVPVVASTAPAVTAISKSPS